MKVPRFLVSSGRVAAIGGLLLLIALACGLGKGVAAEPSPAADTMASAARAANGFGLRLLRALFEAGSGGDVVISPSSVSFALAMACNGAADGTREAIAKTLGLEADDNSVNAGNRALLKALLASGPEVRLEIANALWVRAGLTPSPAFVAANREFYDAPSSTLDFAGSPADAVRTINAWVNRKTRGEIPTIVAALPRATVVVLTDAVYFKGRWMRTFDKKKTRPLPFHPANGTPFKTPMMTQSGSYPYVENDAVQAIRLPYGQGALAMYVVLPRESSSITALLASLDEPRWRELIGQLSEREGMIALPKTRLTYEAELGGALSAMGMGVAFGPQADFSRIHAPPPSISLSEVIHKSFVQVDEEGTKAAAATAVVAVPTAMAGPHHAPPPFQMVVDRPYLFAIADERAADALLFVAAVTDPRA